MTSYPLTDRERDVIRLLAEGFTPQEIAGRLNLSRYTVGKYLQRVRTKLGARNNEQLILLLAWHHPATLSGCTVKHGTVQALEWHEDEEVPLCGPCSRLTQARERVETIPRKTSELAPGGRAAYRRLTPVDQHAKRGEPVECGTMQAARRHMAAGERISDLTCGCREAYREWYRDYDRQRRALGA